MNPLIDVSISLYFEISNSEMFGGEGSVGYTAATFGGVKNIENVDDSFVDKQIEGVANMLHVSKENVKLISKEQYDFETEDEDEDDCDDFDDEGDE